MPQQLETPLASPHLSLHRAATFLPSYRRRRRRDAYACYGRDRIIYLQLLFLSSNSFHFPTQCLSRCVPRASYRSLSFIFPGSHFLILPGFRKFRSFRFFGSKLPYAMRDVINHFRPHFFSPSTSWKIKYQGIKSERFDLYCDSCRNDRIKGRRKLIFYSYRVEDSFQAF